MGIDPGLNKTGVGVVEWSKGKILYAGHALIAPAVKMSLPDRLNVIINGIKEFTEQYSPHSAAVENVFYSVNAKSSLLLGQTRGAIIAALLFSKVPIYEFSALQIKQSVVGYGKAEKEQIKKMVELHLNRDFDKTPLDVTDALACAICLALHQTSKIY
ncbi:MAG: crossover junction endodeoxyribonuclease RuvC [Deferribacteraceae bacterium]|jgi:crossover junction endodeoxyribonuclease RuvC|nr:crossover junction endodeoxyribonuclease RuvC [Deferribacteraceae bacterium]